VYQLYSGSTGLLPSLEGRKEGSDQDGGDANNTIVVEYNFDPESIGPDVKEGVKKRVGQRIRELVSAVEALEERARHAD
jgi:hypothetical protein